MAVVAEIGVCVVGLRCGSVFSKALALIVVRVALRSFFSACPVCAAMCLLNVKSQLGFRVDLR